MKTTGIALILLGLLAVPAPGQTVQVLKRARELNNQNNVRQGVAPPTQPPAAQPTATPAKPAALTPQQKISKIQADLAGLKPGVAVTAGQKQQLIIDIAATARGAKPSTAGLTTFVGSLTTALADKTLSAGEQQGLATDIEAIVNSGGMAAKQFDDILDHVQAILQVGTVKRPVAVDVCKNLRAVGLEVRGGPK